MRPSEDIEYSQVAEQDRSIITENAMETKHRPRVHVFGPFEQIFRICGLDLTYSVLRFSQCRKDGTLARAIISTILAFVFIMLIFIKLVTIMNAKSKSLSVQWAEINVEMGIVLFGFHSAACLAFWSHQLYMKTFQEKIDALEQGPVRTEESFAKTHVIAFVMSAVVMVLLLGHSGKDVIFSKENVEQVEATARLSVDNLWGVDPLVKGLVGLASCVCLVVFVVSIHAIGRKLKGLNTEIQEMDRQGNMDHQSLLEMEDRQIEIYALIKYTHNHLSKFITLGFLAGIVTHVNAMYLVMGRKSDLSTVYFIIMIGYLIVSAGYLAFLVSVPGKIQAKISQLSSILLFSKSIWCGKDEKLIETAKTMIKRSEADELKMVIFHGFLVDARFAPKVMLFAPLIGNVLIVANSLINSH